MSYLFGPVASRRMGLSLGLDIVPRFTCTYSCVYCEVGQMTHQTLRRRAYVPINDVLRELSEALSRQPALDYITLSGSGEPTLHLEIGRLIRGIKEMSDVPVAVITNGSLLFQADVRHDLMAADLVMPSLDAVTQEAFERVNRPQMKVSRVIEGLRRFRQEYGGPIWLEILFVKGINDSDAEIHALNEVVQTLGADRIQLNTVVRPPAESDARPLTREALERIQQILGPQAEIVASFKTRKVSETPNDKPRQQILELLERRGCSLDEIQQGLGLEVDALQTLLDELICQKRLERLEHADTVYYRRTEDRIAG